MTGRNEHEELAILERRKSVAYHYVRGRTQWEIARQLEVDRSTISRDLEAIRQEWRDEYLGDANERFLMEVARCNEKELAMLEAWDRSRRPKITRRRGRKEKPIAEDDETVTIGIERTRSLEKQERDGNPAFMEAAHRIAMDRCRLLGFLKDKSDPYERWRPGEDHEDGHVLTADEKRGILTTILARFGLEVVAEVAGRHPEPHRIALDQPVQHHDAGWNDPGPLAGGIPPLDLP